MSEKAVTSARPGASPAYSGILCGAGGSSSIAFEERDEHGPLGLIPSLDAEAFGAARYGALFSNPIKSILSAELAIRNSVVVISNPRAGSGKANLIKGKLIAVMEQMEGDGKLVIHGEDTVYLKTKADPKIRVSAVLEVIKKSDPTRPPIIVVLGGDGTFADVAEAVYRARKEGYRAILVPGPGGTAGDMRIELGVPRDPSLMPKFLATARETELFVITASADGGPERIVVHSQGNGVSGAVFAEVEKARAAGGKVNVATYIRALTKGIGGTEAFFVKINGGKPIAVGEVLALANSTSIGSVARIPLPSDGGSIFAIPVLPDFPGPVRLVPGLAPVADVARRGLLFMLGEQRVIRPGKKIGFLGPDRLIAIRPGDKVLLEFVDAVGKPKPVPGLINGDPTCSASSILLEGKTTTISTMAAPDSAFMVRRGLFSPRSMRESFFARAAGLSERFGAGAAMGLIGAYEIYRDAYGLGPQERRTGDLSMMTGLALADAFAVWRVGTVSFFAEFGLMVGPFGAGYELAAAGADAVAKEFEIDAMGRDRAGGRIAGIAGGWAATWGAIRLIGPETWKASALKINDFLVRYAGGAGEAVELFLAGAARVLGSLRPMLPILIIPAVIDAGPYESGDPRRVPTA